MNFVLYMHNGSGNHGCEALVRTTADYFSKFGKVTLFTKRIEEDKKYIPNAPFEICQTNVPLNTHSIGGFITAFKMKFLHQKYAFVKSAYKSLLSAIKKDTIAISIGGDNYCYDGMPEVLAILNEEIIKRGGKTILWGCSIEPSLLKNHDVVADLSKYSLITARESITYYALVDAGVKTKIMLTSDSAFLLPTALKEFPCGFLDSNTVGINISPLILSCSTESNMLMDAYEYLIHNIIEKTEMNIALIPHVVWSNNNDLEPIDKLLEKFRNNDRIVKISDCNATELKGYISRCRFFVGARTHATIAAYSSGVPTLVVGYSVKSIGIATDLFGNYENYVKRIDEIKNKEDLWQSFIFIYQNESEIRQHLKNTIPKYKDNLNIIIDDLIGCEK